MLHYAIVFAVLALISGVLGFGALGGTFAMVAKTFVFIFLALLVISLVFGRRSVPL